MTNDDALALASGDRIRLRALSWWGTNPPQRTVFTVARVDARKGYAEPRIVSVDGAWFVPWEVERADGEGEP